MAEWKAPLIICNIDDLVGSEDLDRFEENTLYLYESATEGKAVLASALRSMNRSVVDSATFSTIITEIGNISKDVYAPTADVRSGKTYYAGGQKKTGTSQVEVLS